MLVYTNPSVRNGATTLTVNQMPSHTHGIMQYGASFPINNAPIKLNNTTTVDNYARGAYIELNQYIGGSQAHAHSISAT